jgi:hypothetical protein
VTDFNRKAAPVSAAIQRDLESAAPDADDYDGPEPTMTANPLIPIWNATRNGTSDFGLSRTRMRTGYDHRGRIHSRA